MTNGQIADRLWACRFKTSHYITGVLVSSATRKVSIFEVREALDFGVSEEACEQWGDKVMVRGIDS